MYEGVAQISPIFIRVAKTLGATDGEVFRKVILPLAVPHILTALRVALGVAWATLVASELIAAQGKKVDTGGYYLPDQAKTSAAMRPSATLNAALAAL